MYCVSFWEEETPIHQRYYMFYITNQKNTIYETFLKGKYGCGLQKTIRSHRKGLNEFLDVIAKANIERVLESGNDDDIKDTICNEIYSQFS